MRSPTEISLKHLRSKGYTAEVVEHWVPVAHVRRDFIGIIDILAFKPSEFGVLGIQCTSKSNISARLKKASFNKKLLSWLKAGNFFEVWGTYKNKGRWDIEKRELVKKKYLPKRKG